MAYKTEHHLIAGSILLGVARSCRPVGHERSSHLLPCLQGRLRLPKTDTDRFARLAVAEHVQARESGYTLQSLQRLLPSPTSFVVIKVLGCTVEDSYPREHACPPWLAGRQPQLN